MLCVARGSGLRHAVAPTRAAIRLSPTAWPVAADAPPHPLGQWPTIQLNLCEGSLGEPDNVQARATNMVRVEHTEG